MHTQLFINNEVLSPSRTLPPNGVRNVVEAITNWESSMSTPNPARRSPSTPRTMNRS